MLPLYYPDPAVDEQRRPGPDLEDDGVTATGATVEDQENRHRKLRGETGAGVFLRKGSTISCMSSCTVCAYVCVSTDVHVCTTDVYVCMCMHTVCVCVYVYVCCIGMCVCFVTVCLRKL